MILQTASTSNSVPGVVLILAILGAVVDWRYRRKGGKKSSKKDWILFLAALAVLVVFFVVLSLIGVGDVAGAIGEATPFFAIVLFAAWELGRWRVRSKNPLPQSATGPHKNDPPLELEEKTPVASEENTFLVDNEDPVHVYIDLDVDLNWKPLTNHFRLASRVDTSSGKSLYEYRINGTEVFVRLIEDEDEDIGGPKRYDVRDGVVQESAIRERCENKSYYVRNPNEKIASLKQQVEWQKLDSWGFRGFKYFLLSKRLAKRDARRFFRQELERLKIGTAGFIREAEQYGIEKDDNALGRFRFTEGKPRPTEEEIKKLYASTESFGITQSEFESGNRIIAQLEQLLAD